MNRNLRGGQLQSNHGELGIRREKTEPGEHEVKERSYECTDEKKL